MSGASEARAAAPVHTEGRAAEAGPVESRARRPRDPRLDFFRGAGMFIILIAHVPANGWSQWIPARFGFSDATEIFVFCSGMASALAFGTVFDRNGFLAGTARIAQRVWQIYWAHICLMLLLIAVLAWIDGVLGGDTYVRGLNLHHFFEDPQRGLVGFLTLTYVPNYFDILPMYLGILALVPLIMAVGRIDGRLAVAASVAIWLVASFRVLELPAEPWSERTWFFNPFSWQLIFFLGFALMRGWIPTPKPTAGRLWLAAAIVLVSVPFAWDRLHFTIPALAEVKTSLYYVIDKSHLGIFRVVHFLALAFLVFAAAGEGGRRISGRLSDLVQLVGRQALAVFMTGIILAQLMGLVLDLIGRDIPAEALVNIVGFVILVATAKVVEWFKNPPWRGGEARKPAAAVVPLSAASAATVPSARPHTATGARR